MTTFQAELINPDLIFSLGKTPLTSMMDLLFKAQKYMNGEDALMAKGLTGKRKKDEGAESQSKRKERKDNLTEAKTSKSSLEASSKKKLNFTLLIMPVDKVLMQIKNDLALKWPKPLSSSSKRRDLKKNYCFHNDHGHYTNECRDLKEQIEELIQRGKLQKFVKKDYQARQRIEEKPTDDQRDEDRDNLKPIVGEIRTITRGLVIGGSYKSLRKAVQRQVNNVHIKHPMAKHCRTRNDDIVFSDQDVKGIRHPHDDPLAIMLAIEGFNTQRVLVDNGSLADVMHMTAFQQMKLDPKRLKPFGSPLVSFNGDRVYPKGIISLQIITGTYLAQVTMMVDFLIVDCPSSYNVILG